MRDVVALLTQHRPDPQNTSVSLKNDVTTRSCGMRYNPHYNFIWAVLRPSVTPVGKSWSGLGAPNKGQRRRVNGLSNTNMESSAGLDCTGAGEETTNSGKRPRNLTFRLV